MLLPSSAIPHEDIGCPGIFSGIVVLWRSDNGSISVDRNSIPEIVRSGCVVRGEFCLLFPCAAARGVDKSSARAVAAVVAVRGSYDGSVRVAPQIETSDGDRPSETSFSLANLRLHIPPVVSYGIYFGVVFGVRSDDDGSGYDIDSELSISGSALGADQLDLFGANEGFRSHAKGKSEEHKLYGFYLHFTLFRASAIKVLLS